MDAEDGISLLLHAMDAEETEKLFQRWINGYQHMAFSAFKAALTPKPNKSTEEIVKDIGSILEAWEVTRCNGNL